MGHSSIDVTVDIYGHLVPGGNRQAVDRLDDASEIPDQFGVETKWKHFGENQAPEEKAALQVIEKTGATRRSRTGDLLITNRREAATATEQTQAFPMNWQFNALVIGFVWVSWEAVLGQKRTIPQHLFLGAAASTMPATSSARRHSVGGRLNPRCSYGRRYPT